MSFALTAGLFATVRGLGVKAIALLGAFGLGIELDEAVSACLLGFHGSRAAVPGGYAVGLAVLASRA